MEFQKRIVTDCTNVHRNPIKKSTSGLWNAHGQQHITITTTIFVVVLVVYIWDIGRPVVDVFSVASIWAQRGCWLVLVTARLVLFARRFSQFGGRIVLLNAGRRPMCSRRFSTVVDDIRQARDNFRSTIDSFHWVCWWPLEHNCDATLWSTALNGRATTVSAARPVFAESRRLTVTAGRLLTLAQCTFLTSGRRTLHEWRNFWVTNFGIMCYCFRSPFMFDVYLWFPKRNHIPYIWSLLAYPSKNCLK